MFAGTIAAGGVGITLTAASTVVFLDRSWSPAINAQAEDRLHRIGQKDAVQVVDIMARGTVDLGRRAIDDQHKRADRDLGDRRMKRAQRAEPGPRRWPGWPLLTGVPEARDCAEVTRVVRALRTLSEKRGVNEAESGRLTALQRPYATKLGRARSLVTG